MNQREIRREANFRAGLILDAALSQGWNPDDLVEKYGQDVVYAMADEIMDIARSLRNRGGRE